MGDIKKLKKVGIEPKTSLKQYLILPKKNFSTVGGTVLKE
ncbi:hypothetical protein MgSA37_04054 [Mucilaginibacter gotjawali]|uniref:Uncharacterized protein n=2 Tax=Mucilaginibacter gotjawali TaxID=1550579 RepID=A0A0X8X694_9SPHI|nr:hypothetical protein [Mucilaginibacter gotjawali]BAU55862.1 hypothetical protein MgSA37_04054 [Mucilaginibacter gotjawali]